MAVKMHTHSKEHPIYKAMALRAMLEPPFETSDPLGLVYTLSHGTCPAECNEYDLNDDRIVSIECVELTRAANSVLPTAVRKVRQFFHRQSQRVLVLQAQTPSSPHSSKTAVFG